MKPSTKRNRTIVRRFLIQLLAYSIILLGLMGLVLPVVPTWPLIAAGALILIEQSLRGGHLYRRMPTAVQSQLKRRRKGFVRQVKRI